jgi:hypothetical protein
MMMKMTDDDGENDLDHLKYDDDEDDVKDDFRCKWGVNRAVGRLAM